MNVHVWNIRRGPGSSVKVNPRYTNEIRNLPLSSYTHTPITSVHIPRDIQCVPSQTLLSNYSSFPGAKETTFHVYLY